MAVTHTHYHHEDISSSKHVDNTGRAFGAKVHSGLKNGGEEHTHTDVFVWHDPLKDQDVLLPEPVEVKATEPVEEKKETPAV
jgi:hypothetical protein